MAQEDNRQGLLPSMLDRLIDPDSEGTNWRRGYDLQQIIDAVRRDLEELLNAHPPYRELPEQWAELNNSLLTFGMPDVVSINLATSTQKQDLGKIVETLVARFEPRLRNIRAVLQEAPEKSNEHHNVRFHIEAELNVDPAPVVTFETVLELTTGQATIQTAG